MQSHTIHHGGHGVFSDAVMYVITRIITCNDRLMPLARVLTEAVKSAEPPISSPISGTILLRQASDVFLVAIDGFESAKSFSTRK